MGIYVNTLLCIIYIDKVSVCYLDPLNFRCFYPYFYFYHLHKHMWYNITSALLRGLQKMAASKPISWSIKINTALISLNNNFGTLLTLVLGCFPLDIQPCRTMSDYSIFISSPSENKYSLIESSRPPNVHKRHATCAYQLYEITILYLPIFYLNYLLI